MTILGQRIRAERNRNGITQAELAQRVGVKTNTISQWETGKRAPGYEALDQLAAALNCTPSALIESPPEPCPEDELWELRETLRRRPEMRILFDATKDACYDDLMSVVQIIEVMKRRSNR